MNLKKVVDAARPSTASSLSFVASVVQPSYLHSTSSSVSISLSTMELHKPLTLQFSNFSSFLCSFSLFLTMMSSPLLGLISQLVHLLVCLCASAVSSSPSVSLSAKLVQQ